MSAEADFTEKAEPDDFKNTLFRAMEVSRATWLADCLRPARSRLAQSSLFNPLNELGPRFRAKAATDV